MSTYENTNDLFPFAWRPHACVNTGDDKGQLRPVCPDLSPHITDAYNDEGAIDPKYKAPIFMSTDGMALITNPGGAQVSDIAMEGAKLY